MKAAVCTRYGPPDVLEIREVPKPVLGENEVLVKVMASTVNSGDVRIRGLKVGGILKLAMRFALGFSKPRKPVLGTVISGIVEEVGDKCSKFKKGDEIFAMTGFRFGAYAEYIALKESSVIALKPENSKFEDAATIVFGGTSAIYFLEKAGIRNHSVQDVLVYGATGSVGTSAVQVAKYFGKNVTAVCSRTNFELVKSLGSDEQIDYREGSLEKLQKKFDIVFDAVGKLDRKTARKLLKEKGIYKTVGGLEVASESVEQLEFLEEMFTNNKLSPVIDQIFTLDEIVAAHRYVDTERKKGNIVVKISNTS